MIHTSTKSLSTQSLSGFLQASAFPAHVKLLLMSQSDFALPRRRALLKLQFRKWQLFEVPELFNIETNTLDTLLDQFR